MDVNRFGRDLPATQDGLRQHVIERFAALLENQTRTERFAAGITKLVHEVQAEVATGLRASIARIERLEVPQEQRAEVRRSVENLLARCNRLDATLDLLLDERRRQWMTHGGHLQHLLLEFHRTSMDLTGSRTLSALECDSTRDPLTGLHNRHYFNEILEYEIGRSERHRHEFSILMLDLDDFKDVNDTYGHPCGDLVLQQVAETLRAVKRKGDLATRMGGDEFALILVETGSEGAVTVADKLRNELRDMVFDGAEGKRFHITASVGMVTYPADANNVSDLMTTVDLGLYRAKQLGKDGVGTVDAQPGHITASQLTRNYAVRLRESLKSGRIVPYFQSIIDCRTGRPFAVETLARIEEPEGRTVAAGAFMETIEKCGLARDLDCVIIEQALDAIRAKLDQGAAPFKLFISLSAQQMQGRGVLGYADQLCDDLKIPPNRIVFQIREHDAIGDVTNMRKFLSDLRKKGFLFALDDFGGNYNSFHYFRDLSFDYVKIDGAFVKNILVSKIDYALVSNLAHLCRDLGILTVAEFVESEEILVALKKMGIDYAQGIHLGVPMPRIG